MAMFIEEVLEPTEEDTTIEEDNIATEDVTTSVTLMETQASADLEQVAHSLDRNTVCWDNWDYKFC